MNRSIFRDAMYLSVVLVVLRAGAARAAVSIPGAGPSVGEWDPVDRVFTLSGDVSDTLEITEDDLTLDGAGFSVVGAGAGSGVYLFLRTGVTVENLNVEGFVYGINLSSSNDNTVEGIEHKREPMFSVQYHPEASPGPHDPFYLFQRFRDLC